MTYAISPTNAMKYLLSSNKCLTYTTLVILSSKATYTHANNK